DHGLEGGELACLLVRFEALQPQCRVTWLHCSIPPTRSNILLAGSVRLKKRSGSGSTLPEQALCQKFPERIITVLTMARDRQWRGSRADLLLQPWLTLYKAIKLR